MPFLSMDVPVNGDGAPSDLSLYGFAKTFTSQGSDSFDALVMADTGVGLVPVGRLKGQAIEVVKAWGQSFLLRRLDDGVNTSPVVVSVQAENSKPAPTLLSNSTQTAPVDIALGAINEPVTVCINAGHNCDVLISGISGSGDDAPLARLSQNSFTNIDGLSDVTDLRMTVLHTDDPSATITMTVFGKLIPQTNNLFAMGAFSLAPAGGGGPSLVFQSNFVEGGFTGVCNFIAPGVYDIECEPFPSNQICPFVGLSNQIGDVPGRFTLHAQADIVGPATVRITLSDAAGNQVDPAGSVRAFLGLYF